MFSKLFRRFGVAGPMAVLAVVAVAVVASVPAVADPVAGVAGVPKKIIRIIKKANKRSVVAIRTARRTAKECRQGVKSCVPQKGDPGPAGPKGNPGAPGADGAPGAPGADGKTVHNGTGPPDAGLGANGDFYIDTAANEIYGPKDAGAWPGSGVPMQGPAGDPWSPESELPPGATLTGTWSFGTVPAGNQFVPISFAVASPIAGTTQHVGIGGNAVKGDCTGTLADPQADPGILCIYPGAVAKGTIQQTFAPDFLAGGYFKGGTMLFIAPDGSGDPMFGGGSYAITGCDPDPSATEFACPS